MFLTAYFQEAISFFQNVTEQFNKIDIHETASEKERSEFIFQTAVAFEKFVLDYSHYHINESTAQITITNNKLCKWKLSAYILEIQQ